jgi:hypothetical protein
MIADLAQSSVLPAMQKGMQFWQTAIAMGVESYVSSKCCLAARFDTNAL